MTATIAHFISLEMGNLVNTLGRFLLVAHVRPGATIAALYIVTVIHVTLEVVRTVKPLASADERATRKPFRAVVAVGRASIRSVIIVTVRTVRGGSDADADVDLGFYFGSAHREEETRNRE